MPEQIHTHDSGQASHLRLILTLGILSCVGPFAIDMYLPALPQVARELQTSAAAAQYSISALFLSFGLAQMIYGPVADQYGRKWPLYIGLTIFVAASIGCYLAGSIAELIVMRFVQGLGAAVVMVIPRAIIRDLLTGPAATRLMANLMLVISVSPMLAPLGGSLISELAGWREIFAFLALAGIVSLVLTATQLPETLSDENRVVLNVGSMARGIAMLSRDPQFMLLTLIGAFGFATFFIFLASAPFVYTGQYGLSPSQFAMAFAVNAAGFFTASQFAGYLGERFGMLRMVVCSAIGFGLVTALLLFLVLAGIHPLWLIIAMLIAANAFLGFIIPTAMVLALDDHGDIAGLASSYGGTLQMVTGVICAAIGGWFFDGTVLPMVAAIAAAAMVAVVLALFLKPVAVTA